MIVSERTDKSKLDFEKLLNDSHLAIEHVAQNDPNYFFKGRPLILKMMYLNHFVRQQKGRILKNHFFRYLGNNSEILLLVDFMG